MPFIIMKYFALLAICAIARSAVNFNGSTCNISGYVCSQDCTTDHDSFRCTCRLGYHLDADGVSCLATGPSPILLYVAGTHLTSVDLRNGHAVTISSAVQHPVTVTYDGVEDLVFWSSIWLDNAKVWSKRGITEAAKVILNKRKTIDTPEGLAADWLNKILYVADLEKRNIFACTYDGVKCVPVIESMGNIRSVAVYPKKGKLYWSDWGHNDPGIEVARTDGTERSWLVKEDIVWPNGITIDYTKDTLYWVDAQLDRLERCNLDGGDRQVVLNHLDHPFSIAVFENSIYWSDMGKHIIEAADKTTGGRRRKIVNTGSLAAGIYVYHPLLQEKSDSPCFGTQFRCTDKSRCIPAAWKCDGTSECSDDSDEKQCAKESEEIVRSPSIAVIGKPTTSAITTAKPTTELLAKTQTHPPCPKKSEYLCDIGGMCIDGSQHCDGYIDCSFGEDEMDCPLTTEAVRVSTTSKPTTTLKPSSQARFGPTSTVAVASQSDCLHETDYMCSSNKMCIPGNHKCDGFIDCQEGEDERGCPVTEKPDPCDAIPSPCPVHLECQASGQKTKGYECVCPAGTLRDSPGSCQDINECQDGSYLCSQRCENDYATYQCSCDPGYHTDIDGVTCLATGESPILFYVAGSFLRGLLVRNGGSSITVRSNIQTPIAVAYDGEKDLLFWSTVSADSASVMSVPYKKKGDLGYIVLRKEVNLPEGLAVDWINHLLYVTDKEYRRIIVCSYNGEWCKDIVHSDGNIRSIVVYPQIARMYWTDWGEDAPGIETAGMDGSERRFLISDDIIWPNGITIDYTQDTLYWVDSKLDRLERCWLDGSHRQVVLRNLHHPFSVAVFENTLYWSDWNKQIIEAADKTNGAHRRSVVNDSGMPSGIYLFHPMNQPKFENPCENADCSYICLLSPQPAGYSCVGELESLSLATIQYRRQSSAVWLVPLFFLFILFTIACVFVAFSYRDRIADIREQSIPLLNPRVLWRKRRGSMAQNIVKHDHNEQLSPDIPNMHSFGNPSYAHYDEPRSPYDIPNTHYTDYDKCEPLLSASPDPLVHLAAPKCRLKRSSSSDGDGDDGDDSAIGSLRSGSNSPTPVSSTSSVVTNNVVELV